MQFVRSLVEQKYLNETVLLFVCQWEEKKIDKKTYWKKSSRNSKKSFKLFEFLF